MMNWGKIIVVTLIVFVLFITGMSFYMFGSPQDDYDHDYYEKGLSFDKDYTREENVVKYHAQPQVQQAGDVLSISFTAPATGTIKFERPSDTHMDQTFAVNAAQLSIPSAKLQPGVWQLIFDWKSNGHAYLYQHKIFIK